MGLTSVLLLFSLVIQSAAALLPGAGPLGGAGQEGAAANEYHSFHECKYDEVAAKYPRILSELDLGQQGRRTRAISGGSYQPIRIQTHILSEYLDSSITPELVETLLMPSLELATTFLKEAIKVQPLQGNFRFKPLCREASDDCGIDCNCGAIDTNLTCGLAPVPQEHIGTRLVCFDGQCREEGPDGVGVENADVLVYIIARPDGTCTTENFVIDTPNTCMECSDVADKWLRDVFILSCSSGSRTLAFASSCMLDPQLGDRPVAGFINLCSANILSSIANLGTGRALMEGKRVLAHEMLHILGVAHDLFPHFKDENGQRRQVTVNGSYVIDSFIVPHIVTPRVVEVGKRHFGCDSMDGIPFSTTSHWPMRTLLPELMTTFLYGPYSILSEFSLALLEDSGWYQVSYDSVNTTVSGEPMPFLFGKGLGCPFLFDFCSVKESNPYSCFDPFARSDFVPTSASLCSFDGLYKASCTIVLEDPIVCYYPIPSIDWRCSSETVPVHDSGLEIIGPNSMCFLSELGDEQYYYYTEEGGTSYYYSDYSEYENGRGVRRSSPHCYEVSPISDGTSFAYQVTPDGNEYDDIWCTESRQNVSVGDASLLCNRADVVESLFPAESTSTSIPQEVCHPSCGNCSAIEDASKCTSCRYSHLSLDGPAPNSCSAWNPDYTARLANGSVTVSSISGRVEVYLGGYWYTVCADSWTQEAAATVCRQLGYTAVDSTFLVEDGVFGLGEGPILDSLDCGTSFQCNIGDCLGFNVAPSTSCDHSMDVGMRCTFPTVKYPELIDYPFIGHDTSPLCGGTVASVDTPGQGFPFFDSFADQFTVSADGWIYSNRSSIQLPLQLPQSGGPFVTVFWMPSCAVGGTNGGHIYHHTASREDDPELLQQIDNLVSRRTAQQCPTFSFRAQWTLIVTYDNVHDQFFQQPQTNTFQLVLVTDGVFSFAIFTYPENSVNWASYPRGLYSPSTYAVAGFNVGDGTRWLSLPGSGTAEVERLDKMPGNVGRGGQWVYRIDSDAPLPCGTCDVQGRIVLRPGYGGILGGTPVQVLLPGNCLEPEDMLSCNFDSSSVPGMRIDAARALCPSPSLIQAGYVPFTITVTRMDGQVAFRGESRFLGLPAVSSHEVDIFDATADLGDDILLYEGKQVSIEWPVDILDYRETSTYTVDVKIFEMNLRTLRLEETYTLATSVNNTGKLEVVIPKLSAGSGYDIAATLFQVSVNPSHLSPGLLRVAKWSELFLLFTEESLNFQDQCLSWYALEPEDTGERLLNEVLPCPPTEGRARLPNSGLQVQDLSSQIGTTAYQDQFLKFFHPGAARCYVQTQQAVGASQQCCYSDNGNLIVGPPGGGSVDMHGPGTVVSSLSHILDDLFPYVYCCKGEFPDCAKYYERRPSDDGRRFIPPVPACVYGDPHIVTLDGHKYTFNGKGEYILIETEDDSFTLQGRMEEASTVNSTLAQATVFTALVAKQSDSSTVEFRLEDNLYLVIDGVEDQMEEFDEMPYTNVVVRREASSSFSAVFSSGAFIEVRAVEREPLPDFISTVIVSLPDDFKGQTSGLMGNYNDDTSDDLMPQSGGDTLPLSSSLDRLHWDFGVTWIINNVTESLFTYENSGTSFSELYDPAFTPAFEPVFSNPELEALAEEMCEGDVFCLYDIAATGDTTIGLTTLVGGQELEMITNSSQPVLCSPPCANGACVDNNTCSCSEGYQGDRCTDAVFTPCPSDACSHGGTCTQLAGTYMCSCRNGYSGAVCDGGLDLSALTVVKEAEYEEVARDDLDGLFNLWWSASAVLDGFLFEQLQTGEGFSYVVDSGSNIYMFEVSSGTTTDKMKVKITRFE